MKPTDLGPLPLGDRKDTQQQLSLKALRNRLPEDKFLVRDERIDDKGVDVALEAKVEVRVPTKDGGQEIMHGFTNCRAQGQLKSIDAPEPNVDGSVSYSIETSNLNYLLNGQSPIYFLWLAPTDEIRYAWAKDEWHRLDAENPGWMEQGTFTIRFHKVLAAAAIDSIHERIIKEARFVRSVTETLARASLSEEVVVRIDPQTLESTDPLKLHEWINSSGMTLVSSGYGAKILDWVSVLNAEDRTDPRVKLVVAYAQVILGRNYEAAGSLSAAKLGIDRLSPEDREFLGYLEDVCAYHTGRIDQAEYLRREDNRSSNETGFAAAWHRLEVLRQNRLRSRDRDRRAELLAGMRSAAAQIEAASDATRAHKLNARIHLLIAEGDNLAGRLTLEFVQTQARADMGIPAERVAQQNRARLTQLWDGWGKRASDCIEEAAEEGHPLLLADALSAKASVYQGVLLTQRMHAAATETNWQPPEDMIRSTMEEVEYAIRLYKLAGNIEGETRAKLLLADLFDTLGQSQAAKNLAESAVVVARAMGYSRLESHALEYIEEATLFQQFQKSVAQRKAIDEDVHTADEPDDTVRAVARFTLESLGLPLDRLPFLERESEACRQIARERVDFCRHLNLIQDLRHTLSPSTCYAIDPDRACVCEKHGHESRIRHPDATAVISGFKGAYCQGCPDRSPKRRSGP
jgi:Domain of unknown function (DUF4365)